MMLLMIDSSILVQRGKSLSRRKRGKLKNFLLIGLRSVVIRWRSQLIKAYREVSCETIEKKHLNLYLIKSGQILRRSQGLRKLNTYNLSADFFAYVISDWFYLTQRRNKQKQLRPKMLLLQLFKYYSFSNLLGIRVQFAGRLKRIGRARTISVQVGQFPLQMLSAKVDYSFVVVHTKFGSMGVKFWLCYK